MSLLAIDSIERSIRQHVLSQPEIRADTRQAAVSVVLRQVGAHTEALFILRATKDGDPWSGHMAFPGGHYESDDASMRHAAERETLEEIGLNLATCGRYIGQIEPVQANPRGRSLDMVVWPFVYQLTNDAAVFQPNYEVADVLWGSLNDMHSGESHQHSEFIVGGQAMEYPGYGVGDQVVWGLTYRMVDKFFALLDPNWIER